MSPQQRYIVFDVETPNGANNRISAIGITVIENGQIGDCWYTLVNPETSFDFFNIRLTGITPEMTREAPTFPEVWKRIEPLLNSGIPVAHNAVFDLGVLKKCLQAYGLCWKAEVPYLCTVQMGRKLLPGISHRLNMLCEYYGIALNHHQADSDSRACAEILLRYLESGAAPERYIRTFCFGYAEAEAAGPEKKERIRPPVTVRLAGEDELERINMLRKQVNDIHVSGKPDVFKPGFGEQLRDHIYTIWNDPEQDIAVAVTDGRVCGFAVLHHIIRPENPFMKEREFLDIDEFCVDAGCRRQGIATAMIDYIRQYAKEKGLHRIELNMWEFNREALAFYEAAGFQTYRRYMEMLI